MLAPKKAVKAPVQAITFITAGISSNTGNIRAIRNTPAATIVAAWIKAEIGVDLPLHLEAIHAEGIGQIWQRP